MMIMEKVNDEEDEETLISLAEFADCGIARIARYDDGFVFSFDEPLVFWVAAKVFKERDSQFPYVNYMNSALSQSAKGFVFECFAESEFIEMNTKSSQYSKAEGCYFNEAAFSRCCAAARVLSAAPSRSGLIIFHACRTRHLATVWKSCSVKKLLIRQFLITCQ
jgi:hypothetical protein